VEESRQCAWTTCDDVVTRSGTGTEATGWIPFLYDKLESELCIDTTREYAAGESNGGMMTYQLGVALARRLAAIAPQFGSFHRGFCMSPSETVPVLDLHGSRDKTVPANVSLSSDGYYYTTTKEIFNGCKFCSGWKSANACDGKSSQYKTPYDGRKDLYCISECSDDSVVRCSWDGGHNWLYGGGEENGRLVTDFLLAWTKPSHRGRGQDDERGAEADPSVSDPDSDLSASILNEAVQPVVATDREAIVPASRGHYGDPDRGCLPDEDVLLVGSGRACGPRVAVVNVGESPPRPKCHLSGTRGCPRDVRDAPLGSEAWPACLAHGNMSDPYMAGSFYCVLACPCATGAPDCGAESHAQCPRGSRCERGEFRNRAHGVCSFHGDARPDQMTLYT
jgi:hypothetical protein